MKFYRILTFLLLFFGSIETSSQNKITENQQLWIGYLTQTKFSASFSWWNDAHWVPDGFAIGRTGITYHFGEKQKITTSLGYAYALIYPPEGNSTFRPEHRPWGQSTLSHQKNSFRFLHRLRYEARFRGLIEDDHLENEFNFNYRFRYLFQSRYYINNHKKNQLYLMASNEIIFNAGHEIKHNFRMDQNRVSIGIGYQIKNLSFQLAYMNQLIESNTSSTFKMNHNLQFLVFHNFDLRKKLSAN